MALARLLTADEVALRLNVSPARVHDLARQKLLPSVSLGRQRRFDEGAIRAFIAQGGQALPGGWRQEPVEVQP